MWPRVLAVVLPAVVLGGWWSWLSLPRPLSAAAQDIDAVLAAEPELVVIGNSASYEGVDADALGAALGVRAAKIYVPGSRSPAWYALLDNRVLGQGHHPRLVLVVGALHHMLDVAMDDDQAHHLRAQMDDDDALIEAKAFGGSLWSARKSVAEEAASRLLELPKFAAVGALWGSGRGELLGEGRAVADPALARVFALDRTDAGLMRHAGPLADGRVRSDLTTMDVDRSMVGDLASLAQQAGVRVVFVSFPLPAANETPRPGPAWQAAIIGLLNAHGAGWIDLSLADLPPTAWGDSIHLQESGRARFTALLIDALKALDPLGDHPMPRAAPPLVASGFARVGTPDALPSLSASPGSGCQRSFGTPSLAAVSDKALYDLLGLSDASPVRLLRDGVALRPHVQPQDQGCADAFVHGTGGITAGVSADGAWSLGWADGGPAVAKQGARDVPLWWVYPGTSLRVDFADAWDPARGAPEIQVDTAVFGEGSVEVLAGAPGAEVTAKAPGGSLMLAPPPPSGPWAITVRAPSGGPPVVVRAITLGHGVGTAPIFGERVDPDLRLLGTRHRGRSLVSTGAVPPLPPPVAITAAPPAGGVPRARLNLGPYNELAPGVVQDKTAIGECSPLVLREDGVPLRDWEAQPSGVLFRASDGTDPLTNGRRYDVALKEERACKDAVWLYPGDSLEMTFDPLGRLERAGAAIELGITGFVGAMGSGRVTVEVDGVVGFDGVVGLEGVVTVPVVVAMGTRRVVVRIEGVEGLGLLGVGVVRGETGGGPG